MNDFDPDNMLKFDVENGGEESFYLDLSEPNKEVVGMFMIKADDFKIDPVINVFI